jgi:hypothetical protein
VQGARLLIKSSIHTRLKDPDFFRTHHHRCVVLWFLPALPLSPASVAVASLHLLLDVWL